MSFYTFGLSYSSQLNTLKLLVRRRHPYPADQSTDIKLPEFSTTTNHQLTNRPPPSLPPAAAPTPKTKSRVYTEL